ncbi:murein biosynthesis integral membrane protein MurJ [Candidatus Saccharibacteria bacterium]|nr:murein biosynthesis integral membrane protein MurJ [Candidatus Saccharibacteria bacterium]
MSSDDEERNISVAGEKSASELLEHYTERTEKIAETKEKEQKQRRRNRALTAIARANSKIPIEMAATLIASSMLVSAALGMYRDRLLNTMYLHTYPVGIDAYTVAFSIPDFMFLILTSGALSVAFIPVFNSRLAKSNRESAWQMSSSIINLLALVTLVASILIIIFAPILVYIVAPGLSESGQALAISMMRVIAVNPLLFSIAAVMASIQQAVGRFVFFALSPAIYNIGIIVGTLWFTNGINLFGWQIFEGGIMGVALGVVLGAVLQLLVSSLGLISLGFDYKFKIFWKNLGFRKVLSLLPARSADQGLDYVNFMVGQNLASRLGEGTIRAYQQAGTLYTMPINLIGVAISTAAFPRMTERISQGRPDLFARELRAIIRVIIWLAMPVAAIAFFARGYIVSVIVRGGDQQIVTLLGILCLVILLRSVYHIAARSFYAQQDTRTPLLISLITVAISIGLAIWFVFGLETGAVGIAWAQVIWAALEITALFVLMARRIPNLFNRDFWSGVGRMIVATAIMSIGTYALVKFIGLEFADQTMLMVLPQLAIIGLASLALYVLLSKLLQLSEAVPVLNYIKKITLGKLWVGRKP